MFQFPGFALIPLFYSGISTCFTLLVITSSRGAAASDQGSARSVTLRSNNNRVSGGFPHSEIHGSKPIPGSPWLIAGYHVLHRLLLPRHPPNALLALDLIQKEQGRLVRAAAAFRSEVVLLPYRGTCPRRLRTRLGTISHAGSCPQVRPYSGTPAILMFLSLRCQFPSNRTSKPATRAGLMVGLLVEPRRIELLTS